MGLCKCPKKKVTNLFCFEHRVNVCEHCLVSNHPKCIVQSYLQWLQDSDYDPSCRLCGQNLSESETEDCVRLACYDVFHWSCIDKYARTLPANTAPAGYTCPTCKSGIFPASNVVSPVAEALRKVLAQVNWARTGLGLPLIEERPGAPDVSAQLASSQSVDGATQGPPATQPAVGHMYSHGHVGGGEARPPGAYSANPQSVISMDEATPYARGMEKGDFNPRKLFDTTSSDDLMNASRDHDEDKYKRRPALQWFFTWFRSNSSKRLQKDPNAALKRYAIIFIIALLSFLTLVVIFTRVGRASADNDPFLDPMANPNIRVGGD